MYLYLTYLRAMFITIELLYRAFRRLVIEMVLGTDMSVHFAMCKDMAHCLATMDPEE